MKNIATLLVQKLTILVVGGGITFLFIIGGLQLISEGGVFPIIGGVVVLALGLTGIKPTWESLWNIDENASPIRFSKPSFRANLPDNIDRIRTLFSWKRRRATRRLFDVLNPGPFGSRQAESIEVEALLKLGADISSKIDWGSLGRSHGQTPLMWAALNNASPESIETLLAFGADCKVGNKLGITPLHRAALGNFNPRTIEILLNAGANIGARNIFGSTPLGEAASKNSNPEIIETLLKAGADIEANGREDGRTPLIQASRSNSNPEVIDVLLKAGADVDARDKKGMTSLIWAALSDEGSAAIEVLLKAGANAKAQNKEGITALDYAKTKEEIYKPEVYQKLHDLQYE